MSTDRRAELSDLRARLRADHPRPRQRWSDLAHTCALVAVPDRRPASLRLAEIAVRQTHLRYAELSQERP